MTYEKPKQTESETFERDHPRDKSGADRGEFKPAPEQTGTVPEDTET